jgi:hypothetical protein
MSTYRAKSRTTVSVPGLGGSPAALSLAKGEQIPAEIYGRLSVGDKKQFARVRPPKAEPEAEADESADAAE